MRPLLRRRARPVARAVIVDPVPHTVLDAAGAVRTTQAAELTLPAPALERLWAPATLERLARTYWRFLSRATLGVVQVAYGPAERAVVLGARPLVLLRFSLPEYELAPDRGVVRWRIRDGLLVAARGVGGPGVLEVEVRRLPAPAPGTARVRVQVEVARYHPAFAPWVYLRTQARIHVLVTHGFLRFLARLELEESRVGRLAAREG